MQSFSFESKSSHIKGQKLWWILVTGGIIGALLGLALNKLFIKPLFTAESSISAVINFDQVGHLTQYEQDQFISHVMTFLQSEEVIQGTFEKLKSAELDSEFQGFSDSCQLERNLSEIVFRCNNYSPILSKTYADLWKEVGLNKLLEALKHAQKYSVLIQRQVQIDKCLQLSAFTANSNHYCDLKIENYDLLSSETQKELDLSKGIFAGISITDGTSSRIPDQPVRNNTNLMVLFGAISGFIITFFIFIKPKNEP